MQNTQTTAGETAQRTLVIFRDCHSKNNLVLTASSDREEERIRLKAMSKGFLVAVRKPRELVQNLCITYTNTCSSSATSNTWRKPSAIINRPRPQLGGAFNLTLTQIMEGGAV